MSHNSPFAFDLSDIVDSVAGSPASGGVASSGVDGFVQQYLPLAKRVSEKTGVAPQVLLGQWGLETGWGKSVIPGTNNLGNIKDFSGAGVTAVDNQNGSSDKYRQFADADSFGDHFAGLVGRKYKTALQSGDDAQKYFGELKRGGYAEDADYVRKGVAASAMAARAMGSPAPATAAPGAAAAAPSGGAPAGAGKAAYYTPRNEGAYATGKAGPGATLGDFAKEVGASALESIGSVAQFGGEGAAAIANKVTGTEDYVGKNPLSGAAEGIRDSMTEGGKQARQEAQIEGDIRDPSSWKLPDTAQGLGMVAAQGFGSVVSMLIPMLGAGGKVIQATRAARAAAAAGDTVKAAELMKAADAAARASKVVGAAAGGGMTGGSAAEEVRANVEKAIASQTHEQLMAEVPVYAEAIKAGADEQTARQAIINGAARMGGAISALFGAAGGALNAKVLEDVILKKGVSAVVGNSVGSRAGRAAIGAGVGSVAEGGQELSEKMGQNAGENIGLGKSPTDNITRDSLGDVVGGALVGGPLGGAGGAHSSPTKTPANPAAAAAAKTAAEPNSPLSKAAVAGTAAQEAAIAAAPPAPPVDEDPIGTKVASIQEAVRSGGLLDSLRSADSPVDVKKFVADLSIAASPSTPVHMREQALTRLEFAMSWAGANPAAQPTAPIDQLPGVVAGQAPTGPRPTMPQLREGADRDKDLQDQAAAATTEADRESAQAQAATNREMRMRTPVPAAPATESQPTQPPADTSGLEAAALAGKDANRKAEDSPRQAVVDRAMRSIEQRGGVASPAEAKILAEAGAGKPYDRIDESLAGDLPVDQKLTKATGIALDKAPRESTREGGQDEAAMIAGEQRDRSDSRLARLADEKAAGAKARDEANAQVQRPATERPGLMQVASALRTIPVMRTAEERLVLKRARETYSAEQMRIINDAINSPANLSATDKLEIERMGGLRKSTEREADTAQGAASSEHEQAVAPQTVAAPRVATPAGAGPAFIRRRREQLRQLAALGFGTVARRADGSFVMRDAKSGKEFVLEGAADAQLARAAIAHHVDTGAHKAAASPQNDKPEPTHAQIEAGNYEKGHIANLNGVTVKVENPRGSVRRSKPGATKAWETTMVHHYGDIEGSHGADGDPVDVFIGPRPDSDKIFVIDQRNADGSFDEHKVMMGFTSEEAARAGYLANYEPGWDGLMAITEMTPEQFKRWVFSDAAKKPAFESGESTITVRNGGANITLPLVSEAQLSDEAGSPERGGKRKRITKEQLRLLKRVAAIFGKQVQIFSDPKRTIGDGFVRPGDDETIYVNELSGISPLAVFGHELMHLLRRESPQAYDAIAEVVAERLHDPEGFKRFYGHGASLEELVSDLNGDLMADGKFWREVFAKIESLHGAEAKGIIAKLAAALNNLLDQVSAAFKGGRLFNSKRFIHDSAQVREAFRDALASYAKDRGITRTAMQAAVLREGQALKKSPARGPARAQLYQLRRQADANLSASARYHTERLKDDPETLRIQEQRRKDGEWARSSAQPGNVEVVDGVRLREVNRRAAPVGRFVSYQTEDGVFEVDHNIDRDEASVSRASDYSEDGDYAGEFDGLKGAAAFLRGDVDAESHHFDDFEPRNYGVAKSPERDYTPAGGQDDQRGLGELRGGDRADRAGDGAPPSYGRAQPDAVSAVGIHFSKAARERLDSAYYGTGLKGLEAKRLEGSESDDIRPRVYFYVDKGNGVRAEAGVGPKAHSVKLDNLYDAYADPRGIVKANPGANNWERAIMRAGFDGYLAMDPLAQQGYAVLVGKQHAAVPVKPTEAPAATEKPAAPEPIKKGLMSREVNAIDVANIPGATLRAGMLTVPAESREQANAELERIGSDIRLSRARLRSPADQYAEVEAKHRGTDGWMKAPNGAATRLNERQWVHVRTPAFKAWFGDWEKFVGREGGVWADDKGLVSKVVDANGEPLVVYHGTDSGGFAEFQRPSGNKRGDLGIFTTADRAMAKSYVRHGRARDAAAEDIDEDNGGRPLIYALFINLRNPHEWHMEGANWSGSRDHQWIVEVGGEQQYASDGTGYFNSQREAEDFARDFLPPEAEDEGVEAADYVKAADGLWTDSTDDVAREARSSGNDGAIIRQVMDDGGGNSSYAGDPADVFVAFDPGQLKSADFNGGEYSVSEDDIRRSTKRQGIKPEIVDIAGPALRHLTPTERLKLQRHTAKTLHDIFKALPSANEMAAVAHAGRAKRGWYFNSARAIEHVFGDDAHRFAALLAAMSPQTSVETNLRNALSTWKNWVLAGRPTSRGAIFEIMGRSVEGSKLTDSVLPAWIPNSVTALSAKDPAKIVLSGPKVNSFMLNLVGATDEVTNDAWMANYADVDQKIFAGGRNADGTDPGKGPGYLAMSAKVREAARKLTQLTGEEWTPAEVQETVWSWAKTLYELQNKDVGARELLYDGAVTDELIASTPDFRTQLHEARNERTLIEAGYGDQLRSLRTRADLGSAAGREPGAGGEAAPFARDTQERYEQRAAGRLERLRDRRAADSERGIQRSAGRDGGGRRIAPEEALPGAPRVAGATGPDARLVAVAEAYAKKVGVGLRRQGEYVDVDEGRARRIADAYAAMQHAPQDPRVKSAYADLIAQTRAQYDALVDAGYSFYFADQANDPYDGNPWNAMRDLRANQRMAVFPSAAGFGSDHSFDPADNPLLADTGLVWGYGAPDGAPMRVLANDLFRAVHDAFGHGLEGAGFRARGEENAWQAHVRLFTGPAIGAITSETRGQNSWLNYGPHGAANQTAKVEDTVFADQKTGLMPEWTWTEGRVGDEIAKSAGRSPLDDAEAAIDLLAKVEGEAWARDQRKSESRPYSVRYASKLLAEAREYLRQEPDLGTPREVMLDLADGSDGAVIIYGAGGYNRYVVTSNGDIAPLRESFSSQEKFDKAGALLDRGAAGITKSTDRVWYSQLQQAIERAPERLATMAAPQWAQWLKANAAKLGVKQDEITWSGIEDYLKLRGKDKIGRDELAEWVGANGVQVTETVLGREGKPNNDEWEPDDGRVGNTRYGDYTVPGGTNYREVLLTLPAQRGPEPLVWTVERMREKRGQFIDDMGFAPETVDAAIGYVEEAGSVEDALRMTDARVGSGVYKKGTPLVRDMLRGLVVGAKKKNEADKPAVYLSSHWQGTPNILAHVRLDDRTDADGKRVLFVNEIQSDFGQDTRRQRAAVDKAVDDDFLGIVERMKAAGVLAVECD